MKNTVNDFWKMIWQERCGTIVLMWPFKEEKEVSFFIIINTNHTLPKAFLLWPAQANTSCEYDSVILTLKSMIEDIGFITYLLEIKTEV